MGTYRNIKDELPDQFSIFQLMSVLRMDAQEVRKEVQDIKNKDA